VSALRRGAALRAATARAAWATAAEHPRHALLAAAVLGLLLGPLAPWAALAAATLAVLAAVGCTARPRALAAASPSLPRSAAAGAPRSLPHPVAARRRATATLLLGLAAAVLLGAGGAHVRLAALDRTALGPWIAHAADARAVVLEAPRARSFGRAAALVEVRSGPGAGEKVLLRARERALRGVEIGAEVRARGGWRALPDFEGAARRRGAHALLAADAVVATGARRGGAMGALDRVRTRADRALEAGLPAPLGALARGMVLGEGAALPEGLDEDFRAAGLTHLVAASGANVALLAALVFALCAFAGVPLRARLLVALAATAAYVPLAGGGPSIQRAGVMGAAVLVAALASRPASRWYGMLLAAAVTLAANPRAAGDPGWQLSFVAVAALLVLAPPLRTRLAARLPRAAADATAVSLAASLGTAPLIALHFDRVSLVSIPANVLAVPAVAPVMWLGVGAAAAGQLSTVLAAPFTALAAWPLAFLAWLAHAAASVPGAQIHAAPLIVTAVCAATPAIALARRRWWRRAARARPLCAACRWWREGGGAAGSPRRWARRAGAAAALAGTAAATIVFGPSVAGRTGSRPPAGLVVSALDVGQGDATLVQDGGSAILVDTGPPDGPILRRLDEAGVERLDVLVVTHAQADHEGGAAAVLGALPVGLVLDGRDGVASSDGTRLARAATKRGVRLVAPEAGQELRAGRLVLDVLSPRREPAALHAGADPNDRAIVAELRDGGFSMLLTADAESDVLLSLPLHPVDVLKVSHHGSADDGLPALLARLRPAAALIEVGRRNVYGHPAPQAIGALRAAGLAILRTDERGTIRLRPTAAGIVVDRRS